VFDYLIHSLYITKDGKCQWLLKRLKLDLKLQGYRKVPNGLCLAAGSLCDGQSISGVLHRSYTWVPEEKLVVCLSVFGGLGCTDWCRHKIWTRNQCLEQDVRSFNSRVFLVIKFYQCWETASIKSKPS